MIESVSGAVTKISKANLLNQATFADYYARIRLLALSMFKWENLPDSVNERFLEQTLYEFGRAVFVNDPNLGYLGVRVTGADKLNVYNEPVVYNAYSTTYSKRFSADECVLIRNNWDQMPTDMPVRLFAQRLAEAERSIDVNIKNQKFPLVLVCDERQRLTVKNLYSQIDGNEPVIYGDKSLNMESLKAIPTAVPFVADKLQQYKHEIWNECLTYLGLNNANTDKRERLITDEANANNEMIEQSAQVMLLTRQEACKAINKMFGLNVSVRLRSEPQADPEADPQPDPAEEDQEEKMGGDLE